MTLRLMLVAALLIGACTSEPLVRERAGAASSELLQRQLDLGAGYLRNGDYPRAREKLNRALEIDPKSALVHATFGLLFQLEGENDLAEKHFRYAIRYEPDSAQVRNSYGAYLFERERYAEAVRQLRRASENSFYRNRPTVFENLGVAYMKLEDRQSAETAFARAVQLNPEQPRALLELAEIRFDQQNYDASKAFYTRHTRIAAKTPRTLFLCIRLARVYHDRNSEASCAEALEGIFPASEEYKKYKVFNGGGSPPLGGIP